MNFSEKTCKTPELAETWTARVQRHYHEWRYSSTPVFDWRWRVTPLLGLALVPGPVPVVTSNSVQLSNAWFLQKIDWYVQFMTDLDMIYAFYDQNMIEMMLESNRLWTDVDVIIKWMNVNVSMTECWMSETHWMLTCMIEWILMWILNGCWNVRMLRNTYLTPFFSGGWDYLYL